MQLVPQHPCAGLGEVSLIDPADDLRLLRDDLRLIVRASAVAVEVFVLDGRLSALHGAAFAPCDIGGDGFALGLCEGTGERDAQLAVLLQRMDVLLFKDDGDTQLLERPCVVETVHCIAGKAGDRLGEDDIYLPLAAVADHAHEVLALFHRSAGGALVGEDARHGPHGVGHDLVGVVFLLHLVAVCLILLLGGDPAVGGNSELSLELRLPDRLRLCGDLNDSWGGFVHG